MFILSKNSHANAVIAAFENLKNHARKEAELRHKAMASLLEWSNVGNNTAIQDVTDRMMNLCVKFNDEMLQDRMSSYDEICELFRKFKEYDTKLSKVEDELKNAQKVEKKRENELKKCSPTKNIRDCEVRLTNARNDKEKLQLKYYDLCREVETGKSILFKGNLLKFNSAMDEYNRGEKCALEATAQLVHQIPDIACEDIKQMSYENFDKTEDIYHAGVTRLLEIKRHKKGNKLHSSLSSKNLINPKNSDKKKRLKSRTSCPANFSTSAKRLYPVLPTPTSPPTYSDSERAAEGNIHSKVFPSAPPMTPSMSADEQNGEILPKYVSNTSLVTLGTLNEKSKQWVFFNFKTFLCELFVMYFYTLNYSYLI